MTENLSRSSQSKKPKIFDWLYLKFKMEEGIF